VCLRSLHRFRSLVYYVVFYLQYRVTTMSSNGTQQQHGIRKTLNDSESSQYGTKLLIATDHAGTTGCNARESEKLSPSR
jgi:hypothetical protein